ncbi:uncharacterized protein LOC120424778 [Culex pipiens pallens]|uniref:uncharacterized protein LOC120424778 n=1 Tax=Culex pipiens pallens TaxID=42434 RepID=UPI001954210B|nr:uncharacterized protein LOC120424778 [Culex pipiens pallens]
MLIKFCALFGRLQVSFFCPRRRNGIATPSEAGYTTGTRTTGEQNGQHGHLNESLNRPNGGLSRLSVVRTLHVRKQVRWTEIHRRGTVVDCHRLRTRSRQADGINANNFEEFTKIDSILGHRHQLRPIRIALQLVVPPYKQSSG